MRIPIILLALVLVSPIASGQVQRQSNPSVEARIAELEKSVKSLQRRVTDMQLEYRKERSVELDVGNPDSYHRLVSNNGTFLISLASVERYLNGYKVALKIGNTTNATYNGFDLTFRWGKQEPDFRSLDVWSKWWDSLQERTQKFSQDLLPGKWNSVELILLPTTADGLGYFQLSMETNEVSLRL